MKYFGLLVIIVCLAFLVYIWKLGKGTGQISTSSIDNLKIDDVKIGSGKGAKSGDTIAVHYTGTLMNGKKFDSSLDRGEPFSFTLSAGQVIKGWDQGIIGMKIGGKRNLTIPPELAYGNQSPSPEIPANSTLKFEVELIKIN